MESWTTLETPFPFVSKNNEVMLHTVGFPQQFSDYLATEKESMWIPFITTPFS